ncbi:MAG: hypothetical protein M3R27_09890 [Bacteroidota bacterium]|nr:hypothetical protein [Bacteroidota bacterium]
MKKNILIAVAVVAIGAVALANLTSTKEAVASQVEKNTSEPMDDMAGWSDASKMAVMMMKKQYGEPAEKSETMMMWKNTGQWKRTVVYAKEVKHDFPMPHTDVMEQCIDYKVPQEKFSDLSKYDGSVVCNRTNGEISARCDKEGANFLAINLANDIITGKKDVKSARDFYATAVKDMINGGKPAYMEKLQFDVAKGNTADADKPSSIITPEDMMKAKKMMEEMKEKTMKEMGKN